MPAPVAGIFAYRRRTAGRHLSYAGRSTRRISAAEEVEDDLTAGRIGNV